jgi:D-alanine transaminase
MDLISINGQFNRNIPVTDRGFLFGESVYEVIPLYHKQPFRMNLSLQRLEKGFAFFSRKPLPIKHIKKMISDYIHKLEDLPTDNIYIQVTTGSMRFRDHRPDESTTPNVIIHQTKAPPISLERYKKGFSVICVPDNRSSLANIKSNQLSQNTMALKEAIEQGFDDAIFVKNHCAIEGSSSNLFAVINGVIRTPPTLGILPGITRQTVLEIAEKHNLPYEILPITLDELSRADEVFLSSSLKSLKPIIHIENVFSKRETGKVWLKLFKLFYEYVNEHCQQDVTDCY